MFFFTGLIAGVVWTLVIYVVDRLLCRWNKRSPSDYAARLTWPWIVSAAVVLSFVLRWLFLQEWSWFFGCAITLTFGIRFLVRRAWQA